jgi:hypothetical protein
MDAVEYRMKGGKLCMMKGEGLLKRGKSARSEGSKVLYFRSAK